MDKLKICRLTCDFLLCLVLGPITFSTMLKSQPHASDVFCLTNLICIFFNPVFLLYRFSKLYTVCSTREVCVALNSPCHCLLMILMIASLSAAVMSRLLSFTWFDKCRTPTGFKMGRHSEVAGERGARRKEKRRQSEGLE